MNYEEKLYLMIAIMKDLRGDWGYGAKDRAEKVIELSGELGMEIVEKSAKDYIANCEESGDWDGRWFRDSWKNGGYEDAPMPELEVFSRELLCGIRQHLNYPEYGLPEDA